MRILWAAGALALAVAPAAGQEMVPFVIPTTSSPQSAVALPHEPVPTDAERMEGAAFAGHTARFPCPEARNGVI